MKKSLTKGLSLLLAVVMAMAVLPNFTGCSRRESKETTRPESGYAAYVGIEWNERGEYSQSISFQSDVTATFDSVSADDFTLIATKIVASEDSSGSGSGSSSSAGAGESDSAGEEETAANGQIGVDVVNSFTLNQYTVTRTDDRTLTFTFTAPVTTDLNYRYTFYSNKAVTSDDQYLEVSFFLGEPDIYLTGTSTGAWCGSDALTLNLSFGDSGRFVENLKASMIELPAGIDGEVSFQRTGDTTATLTVNHIPADLSASCIGITVLASAVDSPFAKDITLHVNLVDTTVTVDQDSVTIDNQAKTVTFGKITLPEGVTGEADGLCCGNSEENYVLSNVAYHEEENAYSATVTVLGVEGNITHEDLEDLVLCALLKTEDESIAVSFHPTVYAVRMTGTVEEDEETNTVTITLTASNGSFASGLTADDFTISGAEGLSNFQFVSASTDAVVFSATYAEDQEISQFLTFSLDGSRMSGTLPNTTYSTTVYVGVFSEDRDLTFADLATSLGKGALSSFGTAVANAILPYIYDVLGVDTTDPDVKKVQQQLSAVSAQIQNLSYQIDGVSKQIKQQGYIDRLSTYQDLESEMLTIANTLLGNRDIQLFVGYATGKSDPSYTGFSQAYDLFHEENLVSVAREKLTDEEYLEAIEQYNQFLDETDAWIAAHPGETVDYVTISESVFGTSGYYALHKLFGSLKNWNKKMESAYTIGKQYGKVITNGSVSQIPTEQNIYKDQFVEAIEKSQINRINYISSVIKMGNMLLKSGAGTDIGVLEGFFSVVDSMYNFDSQTVSAKKSFLTKAQYIYDANAALALTYCQIIGDSVNATDLEAQLKTVNELFAKMWDKLEVTESRSGTDLLLATGQEVSKQLITEDLSKATTKYASSDVFTTSTIGSGMLSVSLNDLETMAKRASARGLSLADDLTSAGFYGGTMNSSTEGQNKDQAQYVFMTQESGFTRWAESFGSYLAMPFKGYHESRNETVYCDILIQTGLTYTTKANAELCCEHFYELFWYWVTEQNSCYYTWSNEYHYVVGFKKP